MPSNPLRFRANDVRRAVRVADREGLVVSGFEILPDGTIRIHTVPPGTTTETRDASELDKWLGEHPDAG